MKILVTGGCGFIGSHLIEALLKEGHEIVCVDNMSPYYDPTLKQARLAKFQDKITFYEIDITDHAALESVFEKHAFDAIAHLAAQAGVRHSLEHPETYVETNYVGTFTIFDLAKKHGVKNIVFASTSSVYGNAQKFPTHEDEPADRPLTIYAASKRACELMAAHYHSAFNMNITCLRFFTVYGPWGRPDMALFKFTKGIIEGTPIDVYNGGDMNRDFTFVSDIVDGFVAALKKPLGFEIINLGHGHPEKLLHFIEIIEKTLGKEAVKNMLPMQLGDVPASYAATEKAQKLLGVSAKVSVDEGVPKFIAWYRDYYHV